MDNQHRDDVRLIKSTKELWAETTELLMKKLSLPTVEMWIRPVQLLKLDNGLATLGVGNEFMRDIITNRYMAAVKSSLEQVLKEPVSIKIIIDSTLLEGYLPTIGSISILPDPEVTDQRYGTADGAFAARRDGGGKSSINGPGSNSVAPTARTAATPVGTAIDPTAAAKANLNGKHTFNTFVVGSNNRFCHSAALAVAARPAQSYNPLFLYGGVGLGKTHLMQAIGHEIITQMPSKNVRYLTCERFTNELINSIRDDRMVDFRKRYRQLDVLLMDDIQFIQGKESTQEEFFHTFNTLKDNGGQIVLTCDRPPKAIALLEERLRSRFEWGLIADLQAPDLETRLAILHKKSDEESLQVPEQVLEYIATTFSSNIRELEGALIRANAFARLMGSNASVADLLEVVQPNEPAKPKADLSLDMIIDKVAEHYRIEQSEMRSSKRSQDLALPRHVAMYLAHELIQLSFPRIGQAFANRKHTSALYAHSRIKAALAEDVELANAVKAITRKLSA
jgi:chromosomal replication initiator protein